MVKEALFVNGLRVDVWIRDMCSRVCVGVRAFIFDA